MLFVSAIRAEVPLASSFDAFLKGKKSTTGPLGCPVCVCVRLGGHEDACVHRI
jgi:hypothetical protein